MCEWEEGWRKKDRRVSTSRCSWGESVGKCERSSWRSSNSSWGRIGGGWARVMHHARRLLHPAHPGTVKGEGERRFWDCKEEQETKEEEEEQEETEWMTTGGAWRWWLEVPGGWLTARISPLSSPGCRQDTARCNGSALSVTCLPESVRARRGLYLAAFRLVSLSKLSRSETRCDAVWDASKRGNAIFPRATRPRNYLWSAQDPSIQQTYRYEDFVPVLF